MRIWIGPGSPEGDRAACARGTETDKNRAIWSTRLQCVFFCPVKFQSFSVFTPGLLFYLFFFSFPPPLAILFRRGKTIDSVVWMTTGPGRK